MPRKIFRSNGKLLLFGEYAVLDGAKSLAIPTSLGQTLEIKPHRGSDLIWESYDKNGEPWFEAQISLYDFSSVRTSDEKTSQFVQKLLKGAVRYNTEFLNNWNGFKIIHRLEFDRQWGLGSSSTVISNIAQWADVNPFHLHFYVSNGSGYDIACAQAEGPVVYQVTDDELSFSEVDFEPDCLDQVYFIYLGQKQNSGDAIIHYSKQAKKRKAIAKEITQMTEAALVCKEIDDLQRIMMDHEEIMSAELKLPKIKEERFADFNGAVKSLGAWGGDFCMAVSAMPPKDIITYFQSKGYKDIVAYSDMIKLETPAPTTQAKKKVAEASL